MSQVSGVSTLVDKTSLDITWGGVADATSYTVTKYSSSDIKIKDLTAVTTNSTRDTGLIPGVTYRYAVTSKNGAGATSLEQIHIAQAVPGTASTSITLSTTSARILSLASVYSAVGDTVAVSALVGPGTASITTTSWASSNTAVATVDATGTITPVAVGTAAITATSQDNAGTQSTPFTINVIQIGKDSGQYGLVFYDKGSYSSGWRYMEAARSDQSTGIGWAGANISPSTGTSVGTGKANTQAIISLLPSVPAASACTQYRGGGQIDWFLPSIDELTEMYKSINTSALGNFSTTTGYWSSSLFGHVATHCSVWARYFYTDYQSAYTDGAQPFCVRAVRQF